MFYFICEDCMAKISDRLPPEDYEHLVRLLDHQLFNFFLFTPVLDDEDEEHQDDD